jgi:hypothetical protein
MEDKLSFNDIMGEEGFQHFVFIMTFISSLEIDKDQHFAMMMAIMVAYINDIFKGDITAKLKLIEHIHETLINSLGEFSTNKE